MHHTSTPTCWLKSGRRWPARLRRTNSRLAALDFVFRVARFAAPLILLIVSLKPAGAASNTNQYRILIENTRLGAVEASSDGGKSYSLIGRVTHPATGTVMGSPSASVEIVRSGSHGIALSVGDGRLIRILPKGDVSPDDSTLVTNCAAGSALFGPLLPLQANQEYVSVNHLSVPMPAGYTPRDGDMLILSVRSARAAPDDIASRIKEAAAEYTHAAIARWIKKGKTPITGYLTVNVQLKNGLDPSALTFSIDGSMFACMNTPPWSAKADTRTLTDGEHLLEIKALDASQRTITDIKKLVVVQNHELPAS